MRLQHKVSTSLKQALEKLKLTENTAEEKGENRTSSTLISSSLVRVSSFPLHHRFSHLVIVAGEGRVDSGS